MAKNFTALNFDKIKIWLCSVAFIAAIAFAIFFYGSNDFPRARLTGYFSYTQNPNQASMYFGFVGILAFHTVLCSKNAWHKIFCWLVSLILLGYILLSQSRGPMLALIIALVMGSIFEKSWKTLMIFITLFAVIIVFLEYFDLGIRYYYERGLSYRLILWKGALKQISEAPFWGKGYFADVNMLLKEKNLWLSPHNLLLLVSAKSGVIGGALLLLVILTALMNSYRYFIVSGNWIFICVFTYFIVCMTFDSTHLLYKPNLAWLIFWMPIALIVGEEIRLKNLTPELPK